MNLISKQRGLTAISWLAVIAVAILFITLLLRLIPIYLEGYSVYTSMDGLKDDPKVATYPVRSLKKNLLKRLNINSVYSVTGDDIYVTRKAGKTIIEVEYEVRKTVIGNFDFIVRFQKEITVQ
ncbi:hypothetical protein MNBD_GAMMA23-314 [hydrothermal vent metagenome]|uniref:DUF4845 domain-containing protein n=1 Tax=hydrothermal vent metagenome TaxID=652676 RepID=A0A3B0ZT04_9ZZZZ